MPPRSAWSGFLPARHWHQAINGRGAALAVRGSAAGPGAAMVLLAGLLLQQPSGEGDASQAVDLLQRAAARGNLDAHYNLGVCLRRGLGIARDDVEAQRLYRPPRSEATARHSWRWDRCARKRPSATTTGSRSHTGIGWPPMPGTRGAGGAGGLVRERTWCCGRSQCRVEPVPAGAGRGPCRCGRGRCAARGRFT